MDDWDNIDWDEKVEDIIKSQQKTKKTSDEPGNFVSSGEKAKFKNNEEDNGNYFETNQEKKRPMGGNSNIAGGFKTDKAKEDNYIQPYSTKDLERISGYTDSTGSFHNLIYETFGSLERFLLTHQLENLSHENIVVLMKIDVSLLEVPFHSHNELLLSAISTSDSFWSNLIEFLKEFFDSKHKDLKFLLTVDMNGFFDNIEFMMHNLLVNNHFNDAIQSVFSEIVAVMESFAGCKWSQPEKLQRLQEEYKKSQDMFKIYDIYPTIEDLKASPENLSVNIVKGSYDNVSHYLQVQIPLLKEDFVSKLRDGIQHLKSVETFQRITKTPNVWIHPNVEIKAVTKTMWNMNCRSLVVKQRYKHKSSISWSRRFFNGQMLCFSSTNNFNDLVVAIVMNREPTDQQPEEITIEVIRTENITEIFNRDLIMIEPAAFFEPYHRVFNVLKNFNELNFPFKNQVLKVQEDPKFPKYQHSDDYTYNGRTFKVEHLPNWPSNKELNLESMQLSAVQKAVTNELTLIQGPPGCGKTFVGLEILKILLENTNETILVLTQTNHALDKFLVGASEFTSSIARMGGQSKSDELDPFIVKATTPFESKKYMKKLQAQHRDEVAKLTKSDENHDEVHRTISTHHRLIEEVHQLSSFYSICQKRVIGMTTTFAARNSAINRMLKPGIVLVEEASEVLESHLLVSLTKGTKQLIMIGDHQQLKPLTNSFDLAKNFNFNISLFERLIRNNLSFVTLDVQMRMKPEICDLVRGTIYKNLKNGSIVEAYPEVKGMSKSFFCLNHSQPESVGEGETSKENLFEAEYVVQLCDHLISRGNEAKQITILTAYAAQAQRIKKRLADSPSSEVKVAVLDAYQGEESDIIVLSLVRSNTRRDIGFLATDNRIAVVLTRAKFGFYIIANMECLAGASKIWKKVQSILTEKKAIGDQIPDVDIIFK